MSMLEPDAQGPRPSQNGRTPTPAPAGVEPTPALRAALLDPALWRERLGEFARATNLAVALTDEQGRLLGEYILPPSSGRRSSSPRSTAIDGCPFSPTTLQPCSCVRDALDGSRVVVREGTGPVHFAVALSLGEHPMGVLLAGQVMDQPPDRRPREHAAARLGLSLDGVRRSDGHGHPVQQATLQAYAELLATLGQMILEARYQAFREAERLEEMTRLRDRAEDLARRDALVVENAELYRALQESDRRKDEFLAVLGHELRSPLAPIHSAIQLLRARVPADPELQWTTAVIEHQVQQISRLVDDLLDISRIGQGKVHLRRELVNLADVVERAVESSRPLIDARKQHLDVSLPERAVEVEGDLLRLVQVVSNLLNNAAKYTGEGGRIALSVEDDGDRAILRVRDTGVGIAAAMLPRIFDLFTQVPGQVDRSQGGLGIGLSLVRSLIDRHGGSVQATSAGLGLGSEFVVRLPLFRRGSPPAPAAGKGTEVTARGPSRRILVIDDNRESADSMAMLLRVFGHEVWTAYDGPTALDLARLQPPEVVLCDVGMPGMSGLEVARRLRQDLGLRDVLLVALTGYGQEEDMRRSQEAGFNAHMVKPIGLDALHAMLSRATSPAPPIA